MTDQTPSGRWCHLDPNLWRQTPPEWRCCSAGGLWRWWIHPYWDHRKSSFQEPGSRTSSSEVRDTGCLSSSRPLLNQCFVSFVCHDTFLPSLLHRFWIFRYIHLPHLYSVVHNSNLGNGCHNCIRKYYIFPNTCWPGCWVAQQDTNYNSIRLFPEWSEEEKRQPEEGASLRKQYWQEEPVTTAGRPPPTVHSRLVSDYLKEKGGALGRHRI